MRFVSLDCTIKSMKLLNTTIVLSDELLARLDRFAEREAMRQPGYNHKRSAIVRNMITRCLDEAERGAPPSQAA